MDANTYFLNQKFQREEEFSSWIDYNEEWIVERYMDYLIDNTDSIPEEIYEGVLDDDYPEATDYYIEGITIDDVSDDFINNLWETER